MNQTSVTTAPAFLRDPPRFLFFTGKGGVGKTSIACATAVRLADEGASVLLVSTDPASNVGQVFGVTVGAHVTPIAAVPGLSALDIDPAEAARVYRERIVGPVRGLLPALEVAAIEEQLSGACTTEIASFNEFTDLLTDAAWAAAYDHIIFDTAPTGHTIRLLQLPGSWTDFLTEGTGDASCLGPLSGLDKQRGIYADAVAALADPARTRLVLVGRPAASALAEAARTHDELAGIGLGRQFLVVNGILPAAAVDGDPLAAAIHEREERALAQLPGSLAPLTLDRVALKNSNMVGVSALRGLFGDTPDAATPVGEQTAPLAAAPLGALIDEIAADGHGLIMLMGKGGVGKTTLAAAIAVALAERGLPVHLTTTDPAAHLNETLAGDVLPTLTVSRIDPAVEIARYTEHVLRTRGAALDEAGRAMLREDLRSPCTEEIAVFQAFSRATREARDSFVVMDTAPTGHTLLLIDATGSYDREVKRQLAPGLTLTTPMMKLQDPAQTKVIVVTLAETTPVLEAVGLQDELQRAGIMPWAWIVNNSIAAAHPDALLLRERARGELAEITRVRAVHAARLAIVPLQRQAPVGIRALRQLG
ncbi:arsenical pump-driving ATPase [Cryobacterium melibiosiphilum]|uniref:Arsenical pump-driving ATPase n=1 Tax=Cryobacterium melibiosiphilum TaxID=995039 RepID=A0A3A5MJ01_9MICO|nr:arsenical pump-driving ATPase [Cryobacterium melibiosiphilum]RJT87008.1 arsenical pump-driving ATPase [Cryobacterium melibiosiphilum]